MPKFAVLVSGTSTLLEAMLVDGLKPALIVVDRPCRGEELAREYGVTYQQLLRSSFRNAENKFDRAAYTVAMTELLQAHNIDLVVMAGFMTVLSPSLFEVYDGRVTNSHPSLLPRFKGESAVADALKAGVKVTGTTIHIATAELDDGPILGQIEVPVEAGDTVEKLWERIKVQERKLYPQVIREQLALLAS
jgi:phosphoribosylglycinamide formyltransferase-1